jgi:hypothetical protein
MKEALTDHDRSWVLHVIGCAILFGALGAMWMGAKGVALTGVAFIVLSLLAAWT